MENIINRPEYESDRRATEFRLVTSERRLDAHGTEIDQLTTSAAKQIEINRQMDVLLTSLNGRVRALETRGSHRTETILLSGASTAFGGFLMWLFTKIIK